MQAGSPYTAESVSRGTLLQDAVPDRARADEMVIDPAPPAATSTVVLDRLP